MESTSEVLGILRDPKNVPVLSDARYYQIDVLVTDDKDFLETGIVSPIIVTPAVLLDFMRLDAGGKVFSSRE